MDVIFTCQQAIEKHVKGLYTFYTGQTPVKTHDITKLVRKFEKQLSVPIPEDIYKFFDYLSSHYVSNRYPTEVLKLRSVLNKKVAEKIFNRTNEVFKWLLSLKK
jgi:HEPN domain-containing protein